MLFGYVSLKYGIQLIIARKEEMSLLLFLSCTLSSKTSEDSSINEPAGEDTSVVEPSQEPSSPSGEPAGETGEIEEPCENEIVDMLPADGAQNVLYRTVVEVGFVSEPTEASIRVWAGEEEVEGALSIEDTRMIFTPNASFASNQEYRVDVEYCEDSRQFSFQTSDLGDPYDGDMTGNTYVYDLREAVWTKPAGVGGLLAAQFTADLLFGVDDHQGSNFSPVLTISEETSFYQDMCFPTVGDVVTADFSQNPYFEIAPVDVDVSLAGFPLNVKDFSLSGVLDSTGETYAHGVISGLIDARSIELVIDFTAQEVCDLLAGFGSPCMPCLDGAAFCFEIEATEMTGINTYENLECVAFPRCHPQCGNNGCPNPNQGVCSYE